MLGSNPLIVCICIGASLVDHGLILDLELILGSVYEPGAYGRYPPLRGSNHLLHPLILDFYSNFVHQDLINLSLIVVDVIIQHLILFLFVDSIAHVLANSVLQLCYDILVTEQHTLIVYYHLL